MVTEDTGKWASQGELQECMQKMPRCPAEESGLSVTVPETDTARRENAGKRAEFLLWLKSSLFPQGPSVKGVGSSSVLGRCGPFKRQSLVALPYSPMQL